MLNNTIMRIENLYFRYSSGKNVLNGLSMQLENNKLYAIIGKNGCGKTTLFDCILCLNNIESGEIRLNDKNHFEYNSNEYATLISYVMQENDILLNYIVYDYLSFSRTPYIGFKNTLNDEDYDIINQCINKCNIGHLLNRKISELSSGEKQLVNICRSLIQDTKVIILDEPLSSLDYGNQIKIIKLLCELANNGKTILFSSHNPNLLIEFNIYTFVMANGIIHSEGYAKEILNNELIRYIYDF